MRQAINSNPLVQVGLIGVLALVVGFMLLTRMHGGGSTAPPPTATAAPATSAPGAPTATATPSATAPQAPAASASGSIGKFEAGPGLPADVVSAYKHGEVVVLLVTRGAGIDDRALRASVERLHAVPDVALFTAPARHVARYSRIAEGVDLSQVPALVVLRPKSLTHGANPEASVNYGFRAADSVAQAVRNALYKGPNDLSFYPR